METKVRYVPEEECFIDTLIYRCPECHKRTEVAMMVGQRTKDDSYWKSQVRQLQEMYIRLRRRYDCLVKAVRIVRSENKVGLTELNTTNANQN